MAHILMTAYDFPPNWGGVSTYGVEVAKSFQDQGHKVTVLTGGTPCEVDSELRILRYQLPATGILSIPFLIWHLCKLLRQEKFDHIFCTLWLPGAVSAFLALKTLGHKTPYSVVVHAMEIIDSNETVKKRIRKKLFFLKRACFKKAHSVFCVSQFTKDLLLRNVPVDANKVFVVNNGVNPEKFKPAKIKKETSNIRLFTACRLVPHKGIDQVLKALVRLDQEVPDLQYHIAGDGPDKERLQKQVTDLKLTDCVQFLDKIPAEALEREMQEADLYVMLSRQHKHHVEGFGLVFLEAALCKTPSLGGQSGGIPDAIEEGLTGWLVPPEDDQAIYDKLKFLLQNKELLTNTGEKAHSETLQRKTWKHRAEELLQKMDRPCSRS